MNLQRREEIRGLIAEITRYEELGAALDLESKARDAINELLAHIDTLEQTAAERVIADGNRGPTPGYTGDGIAQAPPKCEPIPTSGQREKDIWNDGFAHGWRAGFDDDGRQLMDAPAAVVPDDTFTLDLDEFGEKLACITINSKNRGTGYELCGTMGDGHFSRRTFDITPYLAHCLNTIGVRAIPADRVLGEGVVALRRFAERCAQRDHQPDEHIGSAKCAACEAEDALRANQGGANHD